MLKIKNLLKEQISLLMELNKYLIQLTSARSGVAISVAPSCAPPVRLTYLTNTDLFAGFQTTCKKGSG